MSSLKKSISDFKIGEGEKSSSAASPFNLDKLSNKVSSAVSGSAPRSSDKLSNLFSPKSSANKLLSVPSGSASAFSKTSVGLASPAASAVIVTASGSSTFRYLMAFLILAFLVLNLILFLIKPVDANISQMYAPVANYFNMRKATPAPEKDTGTAKAKPASNDKDGGAVKNLEKALDSKEIINNIDNKQRPTLGQAKPFKKLPVIPEADESDSSLQRNKPISKAGYCYIGKDQKSRSCIEVGEGDVCMSGDIFPSEAICINPNLRE